MADRLVVTVDAKPLWDASSYRGIGTYVRHLLNGLATTADVVVRAVAVPQVPLPAGVERVDVTRRAPSRWANREHELLLRRELRQLTEGVFHSPALDPPAACPVPVVQNLHDLVPYLSPSIGPKDRRRWRRMAPRYRSATALVTGSNHAADQIGTFFGIDRSRIHVIHHGIDPRYAPGPDRSGDERPYVLFVGEYDPRKGHAEAVAVIELIAEAGFPHSLRMAGRIAPWFESTVREIRDRSPHRERVDLLGYAEDLLPLYRGASVMVVTSRFEGFGFPALEAMACGTPVVAFANSSITEVVGEGGVLVEDGDVAVFAAAVTRILTDAAWRHELSARALEWSARFDWRTAVAAHVDVYRWAVDHR